MALIKGKQLQDTSVSLSKLSGAGTVTVSGTITTPAASLLINSAPTQAQHAVNKEYVDSVATGLDVKKSVRAIFVEDRAAAGGTPALVMNNQIGGAPATIGDLYTNIVNNTPIPSVMFDGVDLADGDRVLIAATTVGRMKINGIYKFEAGLFTRAEDADNINPNSEVSGGMFTFVEEGTVFADTGWVLSSPNGAVTNMYDYNTNPGGTTTIEFTQFSAAGVAEAGVGLTRVGTKFNVNYDNSSIGIDGSDRLYIKDDGVTNAMLLNDYTSFIADSGSGNITLGSSLTIAGGSNGIDTSFSGSTLTINLDLSELSTVTTIADSDFIAGVTANGATGQKITFANLKSLIGAASQLAIGVEGGTAASFDLDVDTLNFATGDGLTFTRNAPLAGTTDTLTITLSNNELRTGQTSGLSVAALGTTNISLAPSDAAEIFSVTINGVALKQGTNWNWPTSGDTTVVRISNLPYAIEATDDIEITFRVK